MAIITCRYTIGQHNLPFFASIGDRVSMDKFMHRMNMTSLSQQLPSGLDICDLHETDLRFKIQ